MEKRAEFMPFDDVQLGDDIDSDAVEIPQSTKGYGIDMHHTRDHFQKDSRLQVDSMDECDSAICSDYRSSESGFALSDSSHDIQSFDKSFQHMTISSPSTPLPTQTATPSHKKQTLLVPQKQSFTKEEELEERNKSDEGIGSTEITAFCSLAKEVFVQNSDGDNAIHLAIIHEKALFALLFIQLVENSSSLDVFNDLTQTPLHLSVITRQAQLTRALLLAGASLDLQDRHGNTALHLACKLGYLDCVGALTTSASLEEVRNYLGDNRKLRVPLLPQNLEQKNFEGYSCAHLATLEGNGVLLEHLVHLGANINAADDKSGRRPLHFAVEANDFKLTQLILEKLPANVDATTFDLCTPLHIASGRCFKELALLLLRHGADAQAVNSEGLSPYTLAQSYDFGWFLKPPSLSGFKIQDF